MPRRRPVRALRSHRTHEQAERLRRAAWRRRRGSARGDAAGAAARCEASRPPRRPAARAARAGPREEIRAGPASSAQAIAVHKVRSRHSASAMPPRPKMMADSGRGVGRPARPSRSPWRAAAGAPGGGRAAARGQYSRRRAASDHAGRGEQSVELPSPAGRDRPAPPAPTASGRRRSPSAASAPATGRGPDGSRGGGEREQGMMKTAAADVAPFRAAATTARRSIGSSAPTATAARPGPRRGARRAGTRGDVRARRGRRAGGPRRRSGRRPASASGSRRQGPSIAVGAPCREARGPAPKRRLPRPSARRWSPDRSGRVERVGAIDGRVEHGDAGAGQRLGDGGSSESSRPRLAYSRRAEQNEAEGAAAIILSVRHQPDPRSNI